MEFTRVDPKKVKAAIDKAVDHVQQAAGQLLDAELVGVGHFTLGAHLDVADLGLGAQLRVLELGFEFGDAGAQHLDIGFHDLDMAFVGFGGGVFGFRRLLVGHDCTSMWMV